jgi:hypothetical protein
MVQIVMSMDQSFWAMLGSRFLEVLYAPLKHPEMFWILVPLVSTVILMELYFSRYPREELGYHAALENTVFLLFVTVDLIRFLILKHQAISFVKVLFIVIISLYAIIMGVLDFLHRLPRNIAFKTSSKSLIGFTAYIAIVMVYSDILTNITPISLTITLISIALLFLLFKIIINFVHFMQPPAHDEVEDLLQSVEKDLRKAAAESERIANEK